METIKKGCVYFFRHKGLKPIKIGYSSKKNPVKRFESMKIYSPYGAEIVGFIITENPQEIEKEIHLKYKSRSLHGEWFNIDEEDVKYCINKYTSLFEKNKRLFFEEKYAKSLFDKRNKKYLTTELEDFLTDNLVLNKKIVRTDLKEEFLKKHSEFVNIYTSQKFNKAVKHHCEINSFNFQEKKHDGLICFFITLK